MKAFNFLFIAVGILLISCSTSNNVIRDDAYYSPYDKKSNNELIVSNNGTFNTSKISSNSQYDYQSYYSEGDEHKPKAEPLYEKTETVTDTNGVVYTSTETYYDQNYLTSSGAAYLQDNYDYYYDDDDDDNWNTNIYVGLGYPYGVSVGFSYGYPYYPHYYSPYYYPSYYYNWYYDWWWTPYHYSYYYPYYHYPYYPIYHHNCHLHHGGHKPHPGGGLAPAAKPRPNGQGGLHVAGKVNRPSKNFSSCGST